ncbi:hypothetical protein PR048_032060 [Dryococelus australis]|uniref:Ribosomal protein S4 n=1 Tax=Dryococelus australis TaxID=614101 RepID=A0ABQ9G442_9NEOP|nr:hypothetical protein PR048_032060 [Dryococelus australis]
MKQRWNEGAGDPRENPPTRGIVRHDSHMAKIRELTGRRLNQARLVGRRAYNAEPTALLERSLLRQSAQLLGIHSGKAGPRHEARDSLQPQTPRLIHDPKWSWLGVHVVRLQHYTADQNLTLSCDGALDVRGNVALIVPVLLGSISRIRDGDKGNNTTLTQCPIALTRKALNWRAVLLFTMSAYTRQKAKSKYRNRIRLERASQKQSSDIYKTPYDRVTRCRERKINIKASERVNTTELMIHSRLTSILLLQPKFRRVGGLEIASCWLESGYGTCSSGRNRLLQRVRRGDVMSAFPTKYHVPVHILREGKQFEMGPERPVPLSLGRELTPQCQCISPPHRHMQYKTLVIRVSSRTTANRPWLDCSPPTQANWVRFPAGIIPEFLHVGIVSDDAAGRRVSSGISLFSRPFIPALLTIHLCSPSSALKPPISVYSL